MSQSTSEAEPLVERESVQSLAASGYSDDGPTDKTVANYGSIDRETDEDNGKSSKNSNTVVSTRLLSFAQVAVGFYTFIAMVAIGLIIIGMIEVYQTFYILVAVNVVAALFGSYGVYKFGTIFKYINLLRKQRDRFSTEIGELHGNIEKMKIEVDCLQSDISTLQVNEMELQQELEVFDKLRRELQNIYGTSKDGLQMINSINEIYEDIKNVLNESERALLLETYYDLELRDNKHGLSKSDYQRFLGQCSDRQRKAFNQIGTFEEIAGNDNVIDLREFQALLNEMLERNHSDTMKQSLSGTSASSAAASLSAGEAREAGEDN